MPRKLRSQFPGTPFPERERPTWRLDPFPYLPHLIQQFQLGVGDDQVGTSSSPTGRFPGLTFLMRFHTLLMYANETRN